MVTNKIEKLHKDHSKWKNSVANWQKEIDLLINFLKTAEGEKNKKYINHLKHNKRFLTEMIEVIDTHELFLDQFEDFEFPSEDMDMDHYKTDDHLKEFQKRFNRLKAKIEAIEK